MVKEGHQKSGSLGGVALPAEPKAHPEDSGSPLKLRGSLFGVHGSSFLAVKN
jgi:hypothetical protein